MGMGSEAEPKTSALSVGEQRADQLCWTIFVASALMVFGILCVVIFSLWEQPPNGKAPSSNSLEYFVLCMIGGLLSGLPHTILTPVDLIKCRVQCGEYNSVGDGFSAVVKEGQGHSILYRVGLFYQGWVPTFVGYSMQGALKFGLYEFFKHFFAGIVGVDVVIEHKVALFLFASATAEVFADMALAPWEAVKIKMQTTRLYPPVVSIVVPRMFAVEGMYAFFKGLPPLWVRQVPYTMMKFATFEKIVELFYTFVFTGGKKSLPPSMQLGVSLVSGFCSGMFCALVSHPADTLVSKLNQRSDSRSGTWSLIRELGCRGLWNGLGVRLMMIGGLTSLQWLIYDSFKVAAGLQTTGGGGGKRH